MTEESSRVADASNESRGRFQKRIVHRQEDSSSGKEKRRSVNEGGKRASVMLRNGNSLQTEKGGREGKCERH